jgi:hypothetical protein
MFNPNPIIRSVPITDEDHCYVVDDALADPDAWVERAVRHHADFAMEGHNAYPGVELAMPDGISERLAEFFAHHIRERLGARRIQRTHSRLSIVTLPPEQLQPRQWICHRDRMGLGPGHRIGASVLYLFKDPALGGTNFFIPRRPALDIDVLVHESGTLDCDAFARKYGIARGYLTASNDWFEKVASIEPKWNRMIFYDGTLFHCSDIPAPDKLSADPARGRLTLNGFFHCTRRAI